MCVCAGGAPIPSRCVELAWNSSRFISRQKRLPVWSTEWVWPRVNCCALIWADVGEPQQMLQNHSVARSFHLAIPLVFLKKLPGLYQDMTLKTWKGVWSSWSPSSFLLRWVMIKHRGTHCWDSAHCYCSDIIPTPTASVVGARQAGLGISGTAELLEFSCAAVCFFILFFYLHRVVYKTSREHQFWDRNVLTIKRQTGTAMFWGFANS